MPTKTQQRPATAAAPPTTTPAPAADLLDLDAAIALLKTSRPTFYRWLRSGRLKGMKVGRQWRFYRDDVLRFLEGEQPRVELPASLDPLLETLRARLAKAGVREPARADDRTVARAVDRMIRLGTALRASDLHLEPCQLDQKPALRLRYRIDGVLHTLATADTHLLPLLIEEWKKRAACDVHEKGRGQDGRIILETDQGRLDLRVCFLPAMFGEAATVRFLPSPTETFLSLDRMNFAPRDRERLERWLQAPWGIIFVTGPTGSGKTTALYACIGHLVSPEIKILSVEDPVEYVLPGVVQVQVRDDKGLTFAAALRSCLRSDPDVVMVGETRDLDTLSLIQQTALTGHLVLTTLHTEDAASTLRRLVDMGGEPFIIADTTKLVLAQRLVRVLCKHCSVAADPDPNQLSLTQQLARAGGLDWAALTPKWRRAVGCAQCGSTGYRYRMPVVETLEVSPEIAAALRRGANAAELRALAVRQGMTTMAADGIRRATDGQTSLDEVLRVVPKN